MKKILLSLLTLTASICVTQAQQTLYSQNNPTSTAGVNSQIYETVNAGFTDQCADDFIVPVGANWNIDSVRAYGLYSVAGLSTPAAVISFYQDTPGFPGTLIHSESVSGVDPGGTGFLFIELDTTLTLGPGHYWMSVQADLDFTGGGQWYWFSDSNTVNFTYHWQNPSGGFAIGCTAWEPGPSCITGNANVSLRFDIYGCDGVKPVVDLGNDTSFCAGNSVLLDAGSGATSYLWQNASIASTLIAGATGVYAVTVTNGNCETLDEINVTVDALPTADLGPDQSVCDGDTATFNAFSGFATYIWSTGSTAQSIDVTAAGSYSVTVTNSLNPCFAADTATLSLFPLPNPDLGVPAQSEICMGDTLVLSPGPGFTTYSWSTGETSASINATTAGPYGVTVSNSNNCENSDITNLTVNPLPLANLGSDQIVWQGIGVTLTPGAGFASYSWSTGETTESITINIGELGDSTISVTVTDDNGCMATDEVNISIVVGIHELANGAEVSYFPNPTTGLLNLKLTGFNGDDMIVNITDLQGRIIQTRNLSNLQSAEVRQLDLSSLAKGIYILRMETQGTVISGKVSLK